MGLSKAYYYLMYAVGFALMCLITLRLCGKKGIGRKTALLYAAFTFVGGVLGAMLMGRIYTAAAQSVGLDEVSYVAIFGAVIFTPLFLLPALFALRRRDPAVNVGAVMDCVTPGSFAVVVCGKFGCFLYGCCHGDVCSWGVYNRRLGETVFPVQLFEVLSMLAVLGLAFYLQTRPRFPAGAAYPLTAALYAPVRFVWEYFRYYPAVFRRYVFGMTLWQFCCVLVFAVSVGILLCFRVLRGRAGKKGKNKKSP